MKELKVTEDMQCPHCGQYYDLSDPDVANNILIEITDIKTRKDPYFCETSSTGICHYKCSKCGEYFFDNISWDNL